MPKRIEPTPSENLSAAISTPAPGPDHPSDSFASSTAGPAGDALTAGEPKPASHKVKSVSGHDLLAKLKAATTADKRLITQADHYVSTFAESAPGDRLAASVAKELKRVRKLPEATNG